MEDLSHDISIITLNISDLNTLIKRHIVFLIGNSVLKEWIKKYDPKIGRASCRERV